ncbi:hypothetical protein DFJ74DRAFT_650020 [Hyaloraphidium curvatum]|nr:hypothetical protein DFJ74DRAFT_650020 [Hyaloraphidium curvatum]
MTAHVAEARKSIESMAQAGYDKAAHEQLDKDITAIVVGLSQPGITPDAINQLKAQADAILATAEQNPALTEHAAESRKTVDAAVAAANNTSSLASEHKRIDDSVKHYETAFAAAGTNLPQVDSLKAEANTLWDAFAANPELTAHANDARAATNNMAQAAYDTAAHQKLDSDVQNCLNQFYAVQPTTQAAIDKLRTDSNAVLAPAEANPLLAQHAADCRRTVNDAANLAQSHVTLDLQTKAILDKIWAPSANQSVWDACRTEIETVCAPYASEPRMTDHVNSSKALVNKAIADASAAKR